MFNCLPKMLVQFTIPLTLNDKACFLILSVLIPTLLIFIKRWGKFKIFLCYMITAEMKSFSLFFLFLKKQFFFFSCITQHVGTSFPNQESNQCPLQWEHWVLTTGPPAKSRRIFSYTQFWFSVFPLNSISHYMLSQHHLFTMSLF